MKVQLRQQRAGIYVRISKDREGGGLGVKRQQEDCEKLAKSLGHKVVGVYQDNDISAYSGKPRPGYLKLMDDLRAGKVDVVICWHTDRLHRSSRELLDYIDVSVARGVTTQTCKAGLLDLSTPAGQMQAKLLGAVAEYESKLKSDRIKSQKEKAATDGKWHGSRRPFGFLADGMKLHPTEAQVIRDVSKALLAGESCSSLSRSLNEAGVTTSTGGRWHPSSVKRLVLRPRNAGLSEHKGEIVGKGQWESIITETEHYSLRALLTDPSRRVQTTNKVVNLLAGLIVCSICGGRLRSAATTTRSGRRYRVYRCHAYPSATRAEKRVVRWIQVILCSDDVIRVLLRPKKTDQNLHRDIKVVSSRLEDASKAYSRGDLSLTMLTSITKDLEPRLEKLRELDVDDNSARVLSGLETGFSWKTWDALSLARKRALIDFLVTVTALPGGKVEITLKHPEIERDGLLERCNIALNSAEKDELARLVCP